MSSTTQESVAPQSPKSVWILGWWKDLLLLIATPLLIVPLLLTANRHWKLEDIAFLVLTFGALGHHAPGLMRAYGDRSLFQRYRIRFIVAPILGIVVCFFFAAMELNGVTLMLIIWGIWHFLMQTYGFARIYDAKTGCFDTRTRRLDFALCASSFITAALFSHDQMAKIVETAYRSGVPTLPAELLTVVRYGMLVLTGAIAVAYINNILALRRKGKRYSLVKLAFMAVTCWFLWFALIHLNNVVLGLAMFEVVHDIQYLTIVWVFNSTRVQKDASVGGFTRFLFRRSGALIGMYIGLVFAYGSLRLVADHVPSMNLQRFLLAVIATSNILHFYYDGFIWKMRESETRKSLGVGDGGADLSARIAAWKHGLKWAAAGVAVIALAFAETRSKVTDTKVAESVVESLPKSGRAHLSIMNRLEENGQHETAAEHAKAAIDLGREDAAAYRILGFTQASSGDLPDAIASLQRSLSLNPEQVSTRFNLGVAVLSLGNVDEAMTSFKAAVDIETDLVGGHCYLSEGYRYLGDPRLAERHGQLALQFSKGGEAEHYFQQAASQFHQLNDQ